MEVIANASLRSLTPKVRVKFLTELFAMPGFKDKEGVRVTSFGSTPEDKRLYSLYGTAANITAEADRLHRKHGFMLKVKDDPDWKKLAERVDATAGCTQWEVVTQCFVDNTSHDKVP
jgi:hypothetical protein